VAAQPADRTAWRIRTAQRCWIVWPSPENEFVVQAADRYDDILSAVSVIPVGLPADIKSGGTTPWRQKMTCRQAKNCGRQPGGAKAGELGTCPAATIASTGINSGANGGWICWALAGTLCGGKVQGSFAQKAANCMECPFFLQVKPQEGSNFRLLA